MPNPNDSKRLGGIFLWLIMLFTFVPLRTEIQAFGANTTNAGITAFAGIFDIFYVMLLIFLLGFQIWREIQYQSG